METEEQRLARMALEAFRGNNGKPLKEITLSNWLESATSYNKKAKDIALDVKYDTTADLYTYETSTEADWNEQADVIYDSGDTDVTQRMADRLRGIDVPAGQDAKDQKSLEQEEIEELMRQHESTNELIVKLRAHIIRGISDLVDRISKAGNTTRVLASYFEDFPMPTWMEVASRSGKTVKLEYVKGDCVAYRQTKGDDFDKVTELSFRAMDIDDLSSILSYVQENFITVKADMAAYVRYKSRYL